MAPPGIPAGERRQREHGGSQAAASTVQANQAGAGWRPWGTGQGLSGVSREGLLAKVTLEQRPEGDEFSTPREHQATSGDIFGVIPGEGVPGI